MPDSNPYYLFDEPPGTRYELRLTISPVGRPEKCVAWTLQRTPLHPDYMRELVADFLQSVRNLMETTDEPTRQTRTGE